MCIFLHVIIRVVAVIILLYALLCIILYFNQEKLIFFPDKLSKNFKYNFNAVFEELYIKTNDGKLLNGLLFKSKNSKGLIFYLHGNAGALDSWGNVAEIYTQLNYDIFILDYPGYGKSEGAIESQQKFYDDIDTAYSYLKKRYDEKNIVLLGYSIGTGAAAYLASIHSPKLLILQAPYYSLVDMMQNSFSFLPTFLLKYKFETYKYIEKCKMPIVIFHGDKDEIIYFGSSLKLKDHFKKVDQLIPLEGEGHN